APSRLKARLWRVYSGRRNARGTTPLARHPLLDRFGAREYRHAVPSRSASHQKDHLRRVGQILVLPSRKWIQPELVGRHRRTPNKLWHALAPPRFVAPLDSRRPGVILALDGWSSFAVCV